jgi:opacity protein-like surface antigen
MKTKTLITLLIILFAFLTEIDAQKEKIRENYLGFNFAGQMHSTFTDLAFIYENRDENNDTIIGRSDFYKYSYGFGLSYKNFREKLVGLAIELNYSKKGGYNEFQYDINNDDSLNITFYHYLDYIELPVMMNMRFGWKKIKFNLYAGPTVAWLIKEDLTILEETFGREYKTEADFNFEFGINGGGGISWQIGDHHMVELSGRYSHGLTNIFRFETINNAVFNQNQVVSVRAHYYYRF